MEVYVCVFLLVIKGLCCEKFDDETHRRKMMGYIVGGIEVPISMFPSIMFISMKEVPFCGGVIISDRVVLTAAHCVEYLSKEFQEQAPLFLTVNVGSSNVLSSARYQVCKIVIHEKYTADEYAHDLSLLLLTRNIIFGKTVQKAIIATDEQFKKPKHTIWVAGYGLISSEGGPSNTLRATRMKYVDSKTCDMSQQSPYANIVMSKKMFCMIGEHWTSDCYGDSGSGVFWRKYLVGIVATGRDPSCGYDVVPSMYTNIVYFTNWIQNHVKRLESLSVGTCKNNKNRSKSYLSRKQETRGL